MSAGFDASPCKRCDADDHENCMGTARDNPMICTCPICWSGYDAEPIGWEPTDEELEYMREEIGNEGK